MYYVLIGVRVWYIYVIYFDYYLRKVNVNRYSIINIYILIKYLFVKFEIKVWILYKCINNRFKC